MSKIKKSTFTEGGQGLCIGFVALYAAYIMFPGMFWLVLWRFLPVACGLSALAYLFFRLELE